MIVIPNDRLLAFVEKDTSVKAAFAICDDVLRQAVEGISDLITIPGIINVDFADIRAVMENAGSALMGIGTSSGEKRAEEAAKAAISSPLLELSINGAKGVLFSVAGGDDLGMTEINDVAKIITDSINPDAKVIFGAIIDDKLKKGALKVTVIATGFSDMPQSATEELNFNPATNGNGKEENEQQNNIPKKIKVKKQETITSAQSKNEKEEEEEDWDIPAFIRRKMK